MTVVKTHINRRSFFKANAIAGGGMVLGFNWLSACTKPSQVSNLIEMPEEWFQINAFLKIGENGIVTIMSPNPEIGQNVKTSMPMIIAEELEVEWKNVIVEQAPLNTNEFTGQIAGGSQSIRQGWDGLRMAGATARQMLIETAAERWGVDPSDCKGYKGYVHGPNELKINYGEIACDAADQDIPAEVFLKQPKDFRIIGTDRGNVDIQPILTGKPLFGIDTYNDEMLYACVLRPPAFGKTLDSYDDSSAKNISGVQKVISFGDKIAVLASSTWSAMKGKQALQAKWKSEGDLENSIDHDQILKELLDNKSTEPRRSDGDVIKAFRDADQVVERIYEAPFLPHNCMEPMNFYAHVTEENVKLLGPIQTPSWTRRRVANLLEREEEDIIVEMTRMGGGFGRRLYGDFALEAAEISKESGTPIQLIFTREDDMASGIYRPASKYKIQASIKDNQITGYRLTEAAINSNMYDLIPHFFPAGAIENYQVDTHKYDSNITTGAWRAPYTNFLGFAEQSFFDELAEILNVDAVQLRLDLLEKAIAIAKEDEDIQYSPERMQGVIRLAAEKGSWGNPKEGVYQGFSAYYSHNTHVAELAEIVMKSGSPIVTKVYCAVDCGIVVNPQAAINQIQGGVIDGIGHAMYGDLRFEDGVPSVDNFDKYRLIRLSEAPEVEVHFVENNLSPTGLGEPSLPPAGGAIANALFKATGQRLYRQPFVQQLSLLG